jgi:hypothetical protein
MRGDIEAAVNAALLHYADKLRSGRAPIALPGFCRDQVDPAAVLDLAVEPRCQALLVRDAARQGITVSRLAAHAVLIYLAELDFLTSGATSK